MSETDIFDFLAAEKRKQEGMDAAAEARRDLLDLARALAVRIAQSSLDGTCTADQVQLALIAEGFHPEELGNAAGSIFRGWEFTGEWRPSARVSNHKRHNRVWRLPGHEKGGE